MSEPDKPSSASTPTPAADGNGPPPGVVVDGLAKTPKAKLHAIIDGKIVWVTKADAQAILEHEWELLSELGRARSALEYTKKREQQLRDENNKLVAQIVSEELHRVEAERELAIARALVQGQEEKTNTTKGPAP